MQLSWEREAEKGALWVSHLGGGKLFGEGGSKGKGGGEQETRRVCAFEGRERTIHCQSNTIRVILLLESNVFVVDACERADVLVVVSDGRVPNNPVPSGRDQSDDCRSSVDVFHKATAMFYRRDPRFRTSCDRFPVQIIAHKAVRSGENVSRRDQSATASSSNEPRSYVHRPWGL